MAGNGDRQCTQCGRRIDFHDWTGQAWGKGLPKPCPPYLCRIPILPAYMITRFPDADFLHGYTGNTVVGSGLVFSKA